MAWCPVQMDAVMYCVGLFGGQYVMAAIPVSFVFGMTCMLFFLRSKRWKEVCRLAKL